MKRYLSVGIVLLLELLFVSNLFSATFDLTGEWEYTTSDNWAVGDINCNPGPDASGICKISQTGNTFTFAFTSGYVCDPPESCTFEGSIDGSVYTCSTTDAVDDEGGIVTSTLTMRANSATSINGSGVAEYAHPSGLWECRWGFNITLRRTESARTDIKVNGSDGPVNVLSSEPVIATISLDPGKNGGQIADWWIVVNTPFSPPSNWFSYVYPEGWMIGINLCIQNELFSLNALELFNMTLPVGEYTFYFALDDPDGEAKGPWWAMDSVKVSVE